MSDRIHHNLPLCQLIADQIAASPQQRITFAEYMELVLYHPQHGYYSTNTVNIGKQGDFFTSPYLAADFGELLAEQFVEMWEILGYPTSFTLVEMGAGAGILAADILRYLQQRYPEFFKVLEYIIIEKASGLIAQQQETLKDWVKDWGHLRWQTWEEIPSNAIVGCCFSNELVDAFPVHQFVVESGKLQEVYVTTAKNRLATDFKADLTDGLRVSNEVELTENNRLATDFKADLTDGLRVSNEVELTMIPTDQSSVKSVTKSVANIPEFVADELTLDQEVELTTIPTDQSSVKSVTKSVANIPEFVEVIGEPSTPQLAKYFDLVGIELPSSIEGDRYRSEINLAALDWLKTLSDKLHRGYILTIDYGYLAARYYSPGRSQGTLQCYYRHQHHDNPYVYIGHQDITAHVDFTALQRQGDLCGLQSVGFTKQGLWLMALGIGDRLAAISTSNQAIQQLLRRRDALQQLIDPMGLGGFGLLVQSQGLTKEERGRSLKGLSFTEKLS